jgi:hypothetical protein
MAKRAAPAGCLVFLIIILTGCTTTTEQVMTIRQLETVKTQLSISSDPDFSRFLDGHKHNPDFNAPPVWRALLSALDPFRFDYNNGIIINEHTLGFYWYCAEFGSEGTPEQVIGVITNLMQDRDFSAQPVHKNRYGMNEYVFIKENRGIQYRLTVEGVERFTGTRQSRSGGRLLYEINIAANTPRPTVRKALQAFPWLACPELPAPLLDYFNDRIFSSLSYGGTWTRYYDWELTIPCATPDAAAEELSRVDDLLAGLGYSPEKSNADTQVYHPAQSFAPIIYLSLAGKNVFSFRIQPHS